MQNIQKVTKAICNCITKIKQNKTQRKGSLNPAYLDRISNWREYGVQRSDLHFYTSQAVMWALEMLRMEKPDQFENMRKRVLRYDRLVFEEKNLANEPRLVENFNVEEDILKPYILLYNKIVDEKRNRGIKKYSLAWNQ